MSLNKYANRDQTANEKLERKLKRGVFCGKTYVTNRQLRDDVNEACERLAREKGYRFGNFYNTPPKRKNNSCNDQQQ